MKYEIKGTVMQSLEIRLTQGEVLYSESGGMAWMTDGIEMKTSGRGGIGKMLGRALSGESLFLTTYTCTAAEAMISFTPEGPGKVIPVQLEDGQSVIAQKDSFMVAEDNVQLETHFKKRLGRGLFGGEGFVLQKLTGPGIAFVECIGEVVEYSLAAGQKLKVDTGHVAMYEPTVNYDVEVVKGLGNILFGEGLFMATLIGPGKVWLQTLPLNDLAMKLYAFMPKPSN